MRSDAESAVADKLLWARENGSPVVPHDDQSMVKMAVIARRRWNSFARRHKNIPRTLQAQIEDLARGLAESVTKGGLRMIGPLISDYRWLAEQIAPLLDTSGKSTTSPGELPAKE